MERLKKYPSKVPTRFNLSENQQMKSIWNISFCRKKMYIALDDMGK